MYILSAFYIFCNIIYEEIEIIIIIIIITMCVYLILCEPFKATGSVMK